jgi:hypothetical protein
MAAPFDIPFDTQLAFLWDELTGKENRTLKAFRGNNQLSPSGYAKQFEQLYERAGGSGMDTRMNNASTVFTEMQKEVPDLPQNAIRAYRFLTDKGLSGAQASGVVGNLMAESYPELRANAFNPEGGGQGAYGIAQWRGSRLDDLNAFAKANRPQEAGTPLTAKMNGRKPMSLLSFMQPDNSGMNLGQRLMRRDPNTGLNFFGRVGKSLDPLVLQGTGMGQQIAEQGLQRAAFEKQDATKNATIAELERIAGGTGAGAALAKQLLGAVKSGAMTPAEAYKVLTAQLYDTSGDKIRSSVKFKNGAYYVITDKGRKVYNREGMLVPEGPEAAKVLREAELSGIAMEGLSTGTTEAAKFQQKSAQDAFDKAELLTAQITTIDRAIAEIDAGAKRNIILNLLPDITDRAGGLNSALRQMGLDIVSSVTFGALSQSELDIAMATAYPPNANEVELRKFLVKRREALSKLRAYTEEAASFLSNPNNTKNDWMEIVKARRDQQASQGMTNPYTGMSLDDLNAAYAGYANMTETQKTQFRDALKAAQGN